MSEWIFTFGCGQTHPCTGEKLENRFVLIAAPSHETARREMHRRFGLRWGDQYPTREAAGCERYELRPLEGEAALGLARAAAFFGWKWSVGLKLVSGQVVASASGEARSHAEASSQVEAVADEHDPRDVVVTLEAKTSARSAVASVRPVDGMRGLLVVTLECGHEFEVSERRADYECRECATWNVERTLRR